MKKKILMINNGFPTKKYPFYCSYIKTIYDLIKDGCKKEVVLLALFPEKSLKGFYQILDYCSFFLRMLFKDIKEFQFIYIHHPPFCLLILLRLFNSNKKVILHWHGNELYSRNIVFKFFRFLTKKSLKLDYKHIVPSEKYAELLKCEIRDELLCQNIIISPSGGVDVSLFSPQFRRMQNVTYSIGFSSHLILSKGVEFLIELIRHKKRIEQLIGQDVIFHVIDTKNGLNQPMYLEIIRQLDNKVIIHNSYSHNEMHNFYNELDLFLMFSKHESLGLVALEAMSCDIPVIANNIAPLNEFVISGFTGECVNLKDLNKSVEEIILLIEKVKLNREQYKPREFVMNRFSREIVIEQYNKIFN